MEKCIINDNEFDFIQKLTIFASAILVISALWFVWSVYNGSIILMGPSQYVIEQEETFDELIDSGMGTAGVESSLAVLKKMGRERQKNVFLISHKDELVGRVNHVMKVIKENGFTSYENDIDIVE